MAQDLENKLKRINFIVQGLTQQAWQDFLSYELQQDYSGKIGEW